MTVIVWAVILICCAAAGAVYAWLSTSGQNHRLAQQHEDRSGWIYFIGDGPDTLMKIGMSRYEPTEQRLPELQTMSPIPLKLYHKIFTTDRYQSEADIHDELEYARVRGEWFEREAVLAYISHLEGEW